MKKEELLYLIALTRIEGVGDSLARNLIAYCGSASAVFSERKSFLKKIPGIGALTAENITKFNSFSEIENEISSFGKNNIKVLCYTDSDYPQRLRHYDDSPLILYSKGKADFNHKRMLSVVGTRKSTTIGKQTVEHLIQSLAPFNVCIVSGLASGTDTNAHRAALKSGLQTIGVLGHGFQTIYPSANKNLADEMLNQGGLLTEFTFKTPGNRENFPKRNRIVAGICDALIVVESGERGGSLITAEIANQYNKDVYAFPGRLNDMASKGCNALIHSNKAAIISDVSELIADLGYKSESKSKSRIQKELPLDLNKDEYKIIQLLSGNEKSIDEIHYISDIEISKLSFILLNLEFKNIIRVLPGKVYSLSDAFHAV